MYLLLFEILSNILFLLWLCVQLHDDERERVCVYTMKVNIIWAKVVPDT